MSLAAAALVGMGAGYDPSPSMGPQPARKRRVQSAPYRPPNDVDLRPAAEAKRLRKRTKRLFERDSPTWPWWLTGRLTNGKGGHGRNRINVHNKAR